MIKNDGLYKDEKECCGCGACYNICPKSAITMKANSEGFIYPEVNENLCIDCKMCKKVCAFQKNVQKLSLKNTYATFSCDTDVSKSASGGIFASLGQAVLNAGGYVYGSAMLYEKDELVVKHICISEIEQLDLLLGSKYIQSEIDLIYQDVKKRLDEKQLVLFSGSPCQIAGLYGYLQREYDNLYTIDIVCHGVPSIQFFREYIKFIEEKNNCKIIDFKFRDKALGWKLFGKMVCLYKDGKTEEKFFEPEESSYYQMFLNSYTYRENCYVCPYANDNRQGNITIGDYWCIDLVHPELLKQNGGVLEEQKGVSCLIVNNLQGIKLIEQYGKGLAILSSEYEKASKYNGQLTHPSGLPEERETVFSMYREGYAKIEKWYQRRLLKVKIKRKIRTLVPSSIKKIVKRILC